MKSLTFVITKSEDAYTASAIEEAIVTEAQTLDALIVNIEEAIALFYEDRSTVSPYTVVFSQVASQA